MNNSILNLIILAKDNSVEDFVKYFDEVYLSPAFYWHKFKRNYDKKSEQFIYLKEQNKYIKPALKFLDKLSITATFVCYIAFDKFKTLDSQILSSQINNVSILNFRIKEFTQTEQFTKIDSKYANYFPLLKSMETTNLSELIKVLIICELSDLEQREFKSYFHEIPKELESKDNMLSVVQIVLASIYIHTLLILCDEKLGDIKKIKYPHISNNVFNKVTFFDIELRGELNYLVKYMLNNMSFGDVIFSVGEESNHKKLLDSYKEKETHRQERQRESMRLKGKIIQGEVCRVWSSGKYETKSNCLDFLCAGHMYEFSKIHDGTGASSRRALQDYIGKCDKSCKLGCVNK